MSDAKLLSTFPRTFWVANTLELLERAAYYGLNSVLAGYLTLEVAKGGLGFSVQAVGFLQGIVFAVTYVLPILGGALADRYGYRRMLMLAASLLATGYFAAGHTPRYGLVFVSLLVMATGAGLFKPIVSGTIARTTSEKNSSVGFGIYYWMINLGAFIAPLLVTVFKGFSWRTVFIASSAYCAAMLLPAAFLYEEPPRPASRKRLLDVLGGAVEVLQDARFMLTIVVYSGFWILYFQNFGTVLYYLRDVVDKEPVNAAVTGLLWRIGLHVDFRFDIEHVTAINAGAIILLQVLISRVVQKRAALPTMVTGMLIGALGYLLLSTSRSPWVFCAGVIVFAIGEMTAHPKYYSLVGLIAPEDRKAVYMGYAALYGVFGSLLGSNIGAFLWARLVSPVLGTPQVMAHASRFWLSFMLLDIVAAAGMGLIYRKLRQDTPETRQQAQTAMTWIYALIGALGALFGYSAFSSQPVQYKTLVQAAIFLTLGVGGLVSSRRARATAAAAGA
jgi:dipeptide/tripeptide permease